MFSIPIESNSKLQQVLSLSTQQTTRINLQKYFKLQRQKAYILEALQNESIEKPIENTLKGQYLWQGHDEFDILDDRQERTPLKLPPIKSYKRIALVRHGQSTWNAAGIIQGSSNISVLTPKGIAQAQTAKEQLDKEQFDCLLVSPLKRARETAQIIWCNRPEQVFIEPHLREVDLYSFQGLVKAEGKEKYGENYFKWQKQPIDFSIDNHFPVRELWYRASLVWNNILNDDVHQRILVVAHNAVNQALLCTALGLPPSFFRTLVQSNGASSVVDFLPNEAEPDNCKVVLNRLNQSPGLPYEIGVSLQSKQLTRLILFAPGTGPPQEVAEQQPHVDSNILADIQNIKSAEMLMDLEINHILSSNEKSSVEGANTIKKLQIINSNKQETNLRYQQLDYKEDDSDNTLRYQRLQEFWPTLEKQTNEQSQSKALLICAQADILRGILSLAIGISIKQVLGFRMDHGSITIVEFRQGIKMGQGMLRCMNFTSHLGRWAVPISTDESDLVCGIDGCF